MLSFLNRGAVSLAVLSLFASSVAGKVLEKLDDVPDGWKYAATPSGSQPIRLQIALQQQDAEGFEQAVVDMSTPGHPNYGKYFESHHEMKRMLLPNQAAVSSVREWLESAGITDIEEDSDWINFRTTVDAANSLLDTEFMYYVNEVKDVRRLRTLGYSIPESVAAHVNMIQPTTRFGQIHPNHGTYHTQPAPGENVAAPAQSHANLTDCNKVVTPQCLKFLYNVNYQADANSGSKLGFSSYLEQSARYSDLELFQDDLAPYAEGQNFTVITYNGGVNDQTSMKDAGEANLDLQYILAMGAPLPVTEFITGGLGPLVPDLDQPTQADNQNEPYLEFLQNVLKMPQKDLPQVISTSYGEDEQSVPERYARSVCNLFAQLGSRGVSVIFSSGDSGVGSACMTNDGTNRTRFPPQYPASCPWVTSVGGTEHTSPERATFFSSGGFSDLWPRPMYQESAVRSYLHELGDQFEGLFNRRGRAFPDVAAQSMNYAVYDRGSVKQYQGTSCSAPMFGGLIGLLNDARLRHNKPPMGFLNPFLYTVGRAGLKDIVDGGSTGCDGHSRFNGPPNGSPVVPFASWNATNGWDPVTGLGTPNFQRLLEMALMF